MLDAPKTIFSHGNEYFVAIYIQAATACRTIHLGFVLISQYVIVQQICFIDKHCFKGCLVA